MKKKKEKKLMQNDTGCKFIRINPDTEDYDICVEIGKIYNHIIESTKKISKESTEESIKKSLIEKISKRLVELKFESNHSIKSKCLKFIVKKILLSL